MGGEIDQLGIEETMAASTSPCIGPRYSARQLTRSTSEALLSSAMLQQLLQA